MTHMYTSLSSFHFHLVFYNIIDVTVKRISKFKWVHTFIEKYLQVQTSKHLY